MRHRLHVVVALALLARLAAADETAPTRDGAAVAAEALGRMLADNARFAGAHPHDFFDRFRDAQHPRATVVGCADSRFQTNDFAADPDGDLFMIRNIGNQIDSNAGSVEYGVRHLHTPLLLVIGHVGCGAVRAAMSDYGAESPLVRRELDGLHLSIWRTRADTGSFDERWLRNVLGNVHQQVEDARHEYAEEVRAGRLVVVGAIYDFRNDLGGGPGRLTIVNVNGETDPHRLAASPFLRAALSHPASTATPRVTSPAGPARAPRHDH